MLQELGSAFNVSFLSEGRLEVEMTVNGDEVLPRESYSLTATGKLSTRSMPPAKRNELYQDYVASAVLRAGREAFALLTSDLVLIHAVADLLNPRTGHIEPRAILSALLTRRGMHRLNFETIDPSEAMSNFLHRMAFKRSAGLSPVDRLGWSDVTDAAGRDRSTPASRGALPSPPAS